MMNESNNTLNDDSEFESKLRQLALSQSPRDRDALFYECGRASVEDRTSIVFSKLRVYQGVAIVATLACLLLGGALLSDRNSNALSERQPASETVEAFGLDHFKHLLTRRRPARESNVLKVSSSIEDISRLPEYSVTEERPAIEPMAEPLRARDVRSVL